MRRPLLYRDDVLVLTGVTLGLLGLVIAEGADLRRFSNALGVAVFGLLVWRLISTWQRLAVLEHALGMLLALSPLVAAVASYSLQARTDDLPTNPWLWAVVAHRCACLVLVVFWTRWLGRRTSPFRRGDDTRRSSIR